MQESCVHSVMHTYSMLRMLRLYGASLVAQIVKNLPAMQKTRVQSLGWEDPGEGNGNPLQYSCPENPMDRGAWQATVHGVAKSRIRLCDYHFTSWGCQKVMAQNWLGICVFGI